MFLSFLKEMNRLVNHLSITYSSDSDIINDTWLTFNGFECRFPVLESLRACFSLLLLTSVRCEQCFAKQKGSFEPERVTTKTDLRNQAQQEAFVIGNEYMAR